jgi:hypothetical protein
MLLWTLNGYNSNHERMLIGVFSSKALALKYITDPSVSWTDEKDYYLIITPVELDNPRSKDTRLVAWTGLHKGYNTTVIQEYKYTIKGLEVPTKE